MLVEKNHAIVVATGLVMGDAVCGDGQVHMRVLLAKIRQSWGQPAGGKCGRDIDAQKGSGGRLQRRIYSRFHVVKSLTQCLGQSLSCGCQADGLVNAIKQLNVQRCFQEFDLPTDGPLCHMQQLASPGETAGLCGNGEGTQCIEWGQSFHEQTGVLGGQKNRMRRDKKSAMTHGTHQTDGGEYRSDAAQYFRDIPLCVAPQVQASVALDLRPKKRLCVAEKKCKFAKLKLGETNMANTQIERIASLRSAP